MERNVDLEKEVLLQECISKILKGTNVKQALSEYEGLSATDLLNYCSKDQKTFTDLAGHIANHIMENNPSLDEYLVLFQDETKEPLDAVLLGLNDVSKPFRKNQESDIMVKLNSDMMAMKKYKEVYKAGNRYGVLNRESNEMKYASESEIASTVEYINQNHKDAIEKLGFVPDFLVSHYVRKFLEHDQSKETETMPEVTPPTPMTPLRANLIKSIEGKMERKTKMVREMADLDRYINFMDKEQGREEK